MGSNFPQLHDTIDLDCFVAELVVLDVTKGWQLQAKPDKQKFYCESEYFGYPVLSISDAFRGYVYDEIDISQMDIRNVIVANNLFRQAMALKHISFNNLDMSNIISLRQAFSYCFALESIDFKGVNLSKLKVMSSIFRNCYRLKEVDLRNLNLASLVNIDHMCSSCDSLKKLSIQFNEDNKEIRYAYMLDGCTNISEIELLGTRLKDLKVSNRSDLIDDISYIPTIITDDKLLAMAVSDKESRRALLRIQSKEQINREKINMKLGLMGLSKVCILLEA